MFGSRRAEEKRVKEGMQSTKQLDADGPESALAPTVTGTDAVEGFTKYENALFRLRQESRRQWNLASRPYEIRTAI